MMDEYFVYLLSCWNNKKSMDRCRPINGHIIYTGYSTDVVRRLYEHITGKKYYNRTPYTSRFKGNIILVYFEIYDNRKEALARELEIKDYSRDKKIKLIQELDSEIVEIIKTINREVIQKIKKK